MFIWFTLTHKRREAQPPRGDKIAAGAHLRSRCLSEKENQLTVTVASALVLVTPVASVMTQR